MPNGAVASRHPTETPLLSLRPSFALHQPTICPLFHQAVRVAVSFHNSPASRFSPRELTTVPRFAYICASLLHGPRGLSPRQSRSGQLPCSGHAARVATLDQRGGGCADGTRGGRQAWATTSGCCRARERMWECGAGRSRVRRGPVGCCCFCWSWRAWAGAAPGAEATAAGGGEAAEAEAAEETVKTSRRCRALTYYGSVVGALMSCTQAWCFVQGRAL
jgi:hypothetical protein